MSCKKCEHRNHQVGFHCPCECHQPVDTIILERDAKREVKK